MQEITLNHGKVGVKYKILKMKDLSNALSVYSINPESIIEIMNISLFRQLMKIKIHLDFGEISFMIRRSLAKNIIIQKYE